MNGKRYNKTKVYKAYINMYDMNLTETESMIS